MPGARHQPQLALQHWVPAGQVTSPQSALSGTQLALPPLALQWVPAAQRTVAHGSVTASGTHAQTPGELSKCEPMTHNAVSIHSQMPPQSAPPFSGSQSSLGSSTQFPAPGQGIPAMPPQNTEGQAPVALTEIPAAAASHEFA